MIQKTQGKIDYSTKHGIMVGYINNRQEVQAVESGWKITPEEMAKFLTEKFSSKEKAVEVVNFLNLGHLKNELAGNLSGGQKKLKKMTIGMLMDLVMLSNPTYLGTRKR